ncbi:MAG: hypothetical protein H8D87_20140 [Deltaproteobacteria bacterium]|nr:hypothetical protein [Candidatus Desulfobacula maris]
MAFYKSIRIEFVSDEVILPKVLTSGVWAKCKEGFVCLGEAWKAIKEVYILKNEIWIKTKN